MVMNRTKGSTPLLLILILAITVEPTYAQEASKAKSDNEAQKANEKKALALLDEIASAAMTMTLADNRMFIQFNLAELLWSRDEKRARALFQDATNSLISLINNDFADNNQHSITFALRERTLTTGPRRFRPRKGSSRQISASGNAPDGTTACRARHIGKPAKMNI